MRTQVALSPTKLPHPRVRAVTNPKALAVAHLVLRNADVTTRVDRRRWLMLAGLPVAAWAWGCAAPTLPLPPPAAPSVVSVGPNLYRLRGERSVEPLAIVIIFKNDLSLAQPDRVDAAEADAEGTWEKTIVANPGTVIDLWQESGSTRSPPVTFQLPSR